MAQKLFAIAAKSDNSSRFSVRLRPQFSNLGLHLRQQLKIINALSAVVIKRFVTVHGLAEQTIDLLDTALVRTTSFMTLNKIARYIGIAGMAADACVTTAFKTDTRVPTLGDETLADANNALVEVFRSTNGAVPINIPGDLLAM